MSFFETGCPFQAVERAKVEGPAELARQNFSTAGHANRCETESEKRSSENLIRQRGQRNDLNPGEFASRASLRSCLGARRRARWISARSMFESGGKSVRCQNLHEPLLSPCMFEPRGQISPLPKSARTIFELEGLKRFSFIRPAFLSQRCGSFATTYNSAPIAFVLSLFEYVMPSCAVENCWRVLLLWLCGDGAFRLLSRTANEPQWLGIERQATDCNESWYGADFFSRCRCWNDQVFPFLFSGTMDVLHCRTRTCCMRCDLSARAIATITFQGDHKDIQETFSDRT